LSQIVIVESHHNVKAAVEDFAVFSFRFCFLFVIAVVGNDLYTSTLPLSKREVELAIHGILKKESINTTS
jgi:hypothetical protein